jgi:predicted amidohydrolase YtcJ
LRRWAAASRFSTAWRFRANISSNVTAKAAEATPPIKRMMEAGIPVGAGTDATRVASYNPWVSLSWLVTGRTVGGLSLYPVRNRLDRETALRLWTQANTWFSNEQGKKGQIVAGQLADLACSPTISSPCPIMRSSTSAR